MEERACSNCVCDADVSPCPLWTKSRVAFHPAFPGTRESRGNSPSQDEIMLDFFGKQGPHRELLLVSVASSLKELLCQGGICRWQNVPVPSVHLRGSLKMVPELGAATAALAPVLTAQMSSSSSSLSSSWKSLLFKAPAQHQYLHPPIFVPLAKSGRLHQSSRSQPF